MRITNDGSLRWYQLIENYSSFYSTRLLSIDSSSFLLAGVGQIYGLFPELDQFISLHWIDNEGNWFRNVTFNCWDNCWLGDIIPLQNGSLIVILSGWKANRALWLGADGSLLSNHTYAPIRLNFRCAHGCQDGGFVVVGENHTSQPVSLSIIRVNGSGSLLWKCDYTTEFNLQARHVCEDGESGFLVVGEMGNETTSPPTSLWLKRVDAFGNTIWTLPLQTSSIDSVSGITKTISGDYVISGNRNGIAYCWRVNNLGDIVWESDFGGDKNVVFADIITCQNGDYVAIGTDNTLSSNPMSLVRRFDEQMAPTSPTLFNVYLPHPFPHFLLTWSTSSDIDGTVVGYRLQISPSATFSNNVTSLYLTSNSTSILPSDHHLLYYRVAAIDDRGTFSYWSNILLINFDELILLYNVILATTIGILVVVIILTSFIFVRYKQKNKHQTRRNL
ncbi:MAG: hypothetical protein ACFFCF_05265 [Promethearchaeota archaeon]